MPGNIIDNTYLFGISFKNSDKEVLGNRKIYPNIKGLDVELNKVANYIFNSDVNIVYHPFRKFLYIYHEGDVCGTFHKYTVAELAFISFIRKVLEINDNQIFFIDLDFIKNNSERCSVHNDLMINMPIDELFKIIGGIYLKISKKILVAFILNLIFSIFEFLGGLYTNSIAIMSDSIHDFGDALSIGISYFLEKKSETKADETYSYGYSRFSTLGAIITTLILLIGSIIVIINSVNRLVNPEPINYDGMLIFAVMGVIINFLAAYFTHGGHSLNQKAVNLHMMEDILGWVVVLIGSIIMKFTDISILDSIMSIGVSLFILISSLKNLKSILNLFLDKVPEYISIHDMNHHLRDIPGVKDVHHLHIWGINENIRCATLHVVVNDGDIKKIKELIREEFHEHGVVHITIEIEFPGEECEERECDIGIGSIHLYNHHHGNLGIHHHKH